MKKTISSVTISKQPVKVDDVQSSVSSEGIIHYRLQLCCSECHSSYFFTIKLTILVAESVACPECGNKNWLTFKTIKAAVERDNSKRSIIDRPVYQYDIVYVKELSASQNLHSDAPTAIKLLSEFWLNTLSQQTLSGDKISSTKVDDYID